MLLKKKVSEKRKEESVNANSSSSSTISAIRARKEDTINFDLQDFLKNSQPPQLNFKDIIFLYIGSHGLKVTL